MDLSSILSVVGNNVWIIVFFVIALSVIVAIHEYGHYIVGRWCGIYAEVFSIGFGHVIWSRTDKRGTVWQIAALPFGGYVKFLGDANAASVGGTAQVEGFTERQTMLGAPVWARAATVAAGPIFNFILAILIFAGYLLWNGKPYENPIFEHDHHMPAQFMSELQQGDIIIRAGGVTLNSDGDGEGEIPVSPTLEYDIIRDGVEMTVNGPYLVPPRIEALNPRGAADEAGMKIGDVIIEIDGQEIYAFAQIVEIVPAAEGKDLAIKVWRDGDTVDLTMAPRRQDLPTDDGFETRWLIGISGTVFFEQGTQPVGVWEALKSGSQQLWMRITTSLSGLWHIVTGGISTCNLSGPVAIAQASGSMASQGTESFVLFIGMLSAAVGLINLFPIPVLDGGHLVFHAYEAITRRKPGEKAVQVLMMIGVSIVGAVMIFAILNDLVLCP